MKSVEPVFESNSACRAAFNFKGYSLRILASVLVMLLISSLAPEMLLAREWSQFSSSIDVSSRKVAGEYGVSVSRIAAASSTDKLPQNDGGLDNDERLKRLRQQAETGDAQAQVALAQKYLMEGASEADIIVAKRWLQTAYRNGEAMGAYLLGRLYGGQYPGLSREWDTELQIEWMMRAAALGMGDAAFVVGYVFEHDMRYPEHLVQAYKWYIIANELGGNVDGNYLTFLRRRLSDEENEKAEISAREWLSRLERGGFQD